MAEWINLLSDIPNRVEDDETGNMELAMYASAAVIANGQIRELGLDTTLVAPLEDIILRPMRQEIYQENESILETLSNHLATSKVCGLIVQNPGQKDVLLGALTQTYNVIEVTAEELSNISDGIFKAKLEKMIAKPTQAVPAILVTYGMEGFSLLEAHAPGLCESISWALSRPILPKDRSKHRVVVIGASGFLGRAIYSKFKREGFDVVGTQTNSKIDELQFLDVTSSELLRKFLKKTHPEIIVYAAGLLADEAERNPELSSALNYEAIRNIRSHSEAKIIAFSSDQVFGIANQPPYFSYSSRTPATVYGRHKAEAENLVKNDRNLITIRAGALYGFNGFEDKNTFPIDTLNTLASNQTIYVDDKREIFPLPVEKAAETVLKLAFSDWHGVCAICGEETTYLEWSNILRKTFQVGKPNQIIVGDMKKQTIRPQKAKMVSIDAARDLVTETEQLQKELVHSLDTCKEPRVVPAPIDVSDAEFFGEVTETLVQAGAKEFELDAMDGKVTPTAKNVLERLRFLKACYPNIQTRVHLMVQNPLQGFVEEYAKQGADIISIHTSSFKKSQTLAEAIRAIRRYKAKPVLIINHDESLDKTTQDIIRQEKIDEVIVMGVTPGVRGQSFNLKALDIVRDLKHFATTENIPLDIGVDGGLNIEIVKSAAQAGASVFIGWSIMAKNPKGLRAGFNEVQQHVEKISNPKSNDWWIDWQKTKQLTNDVVS